MLCEKSLCDAPLNFWGYPEYLYRKVSEKTSFGNCIRLVYACAEFSHGSGQISYFSSSKTFNVLMCIKRANNSRITAVYILFKCMNIVYLCFILDNLECIAPSHSFLMLELIFLVLVMAWLTQKLFLWSNKVYYIRLKIWLNKDPVQSFTMEIDRKRREQSNPEKYRTVLSKLSLGLKRNCIVAKQIFSE